MITDVDVVLRLKRTWKGLELLTSFFATLEKVQAAMNDDNAFRLWCIDNLDISVDEIMRVSAVLAKADAARVKSNLSKAKKQTKRRKAKPMLLLSYDAR